jgi:hypothetical protein
MSKRVWFLAGLLLFAGLTAVTTHVLSAPPPAISGVTVAANYQEYSGPCPAKLKFTATVNVTQLPMSFNYQWERSDGAKSKLKVMHVPSGHTGPVTIVEEWQLGTKGKQVQVSEKLHVKSGNLDITSAPAVVVVNCR